MSKYEPVIGLEIHAELETESKMFCGCKVVDSTMAEPNRHVCPVCCGMPGMLPVPNQDAIRMGIMVAQALNCEIQPFNKFDRKNYFYPDLPKGYQISQFDFPLALNGYVDIETSNGPKRIRVRRVHLEEDTGKLFHLDPKVDGAKGALVDLNRAGVPLLEIVTEPDIANAEEAEAYCRAVRAVVQYLGVNSGNMQKGVIRFEANISVREKGTDVLNPRVEIKNLNSFRALRNGTEYEIKRQSKVYDKGGTVDQETRGWNEKTEKTTIQRSKEDAHDYRYFPEPDIPPLNIDMDWVAEIAKTLPELPAAKKARYEDLGLSSYDAGVIVAEPESAAWFDTALSAADAHSADIAPKKVVNWMTAELFGLMNAESLSIDEQPITPQMLVSLIGLVEGGKINGKTGKAVLAEMFDAGGGDPEQIVKDKGLAQVSDASAIEDAINAVIDANPEQLAQYLDGKDSLSNWFFGQTMRAMKGKANPQVVRPVLNKLLEARKG